MRKTVMPGHQKKKGVNHVLVTVTGDGMERGGSLKVMTVALAVLVVIHLLKMVTKLVT